MNITVKSIKKMEEIQEIANLSQRIWDLSDREVPSALEMRSVSRFGILLGAFDERNSIIGFIYAFPMSNSRHYSHMMGIDPEYQSKGVGLVLKKEHRLSALNQGVEVIEWTVDPLLPNNANLNFTKLGCKCNIYFENYYGSTNETIGIYSGLPTDRFLVEWHLNDPGVIQRLEKKDMSKTLDEKKLIKKFPLLNNNINEITMKHTQEELESLNRCSVLVPSDFQKIRKNNLKLAQDWRLFFRNIAKTLFSLNFYAIDYVVSNKTSIDQKNYYLFEKKQNITSK
ncbi:MAG: GNAT family N-acetyltransferase [Candidatus Hodarchaeales archaeon]|jgi:predicted GNAT superfamily acetyltransferase